MKSFSSPGGFAAYLRQVRATVPEAVRHGADQAGKLVAADAKASIGEYQDAVGPFAAWAPLPQATLYGGVSPSGHRFPGKVELGYSLPDNPELRDGELRDSIGHTVEAQGGSGSVTAKTTVGSTSEVMVFQEQGTQYMPARSILGAAMFRKAEDAVKAAGKAWAYALAGKPPENG